jgi:lipopolysaccharide heptosyltransferase II
MGYRNILVLNPTHIGDCLFTTPALRALREGFPEARIVVAVPENACDLFVANPQVDELLLRPCSGARRKMQFLRAVRRRRFDLVVSFKERTLLYALAARVSGARLTVASPYWRTALFYHRTVERIGEHEVDKHATVVAALGLPRPDTPPELYVTPEHEIAAEQHLRAAGWRASERLIGLNPGASQEFKRWPAEHFATVGDRLATEWGCRVAIFGGPGEEALGSRVIDTMATPAINLVGRLSLGETAAAMLRCELVISNDTGPMHMAAALGVPVVGLFGPTQPNKWGPLGPRQVILRAPSHCPHCTERCMHTLTVDDCLAAAARLLNESCVPV